MGTLDGKTALVTGAAGGIGGASARALASAGATVLAASRRPADVLAAWDLAAAERLVTIDVDLADAESVRRMCGDVETRCNSRLDVLVLSAGVIHLGLTPEVSDAQLDEIYQVNLRSAYIIVRELGPALRRSRGHIVVVNTTAVRRPRPENLAYSAVETALAVLTEGWRDEFEGDVAITAIHPGRTDTRMQQYVRGWEGHVSDMPLLSPQSVASAIMRIASVDSAIDVDSLWLRPAFRSSAR